MIDKLKDLIRGEIEAQRQEAKLGAQIYYDSTGVVIETRVSRNPNLNRNGGDYDNETRLMIADNGIRIDYWDSSDWDDQESPGFYEINLTVEQLHELVRELAQDVADGESVWKSFRMMRGERDALNIAAEKSGIDASEFVRNLLREAIPDFPHYQHAPGRS